MSCNSHELSLSAMSNIDLLAILIGKKAAKSLVNKSLVDIFGFSNRKGNAANESLAEYRIHQPISAAKELFTRCMQEEMMTSEMSASNPSVVRSFLCSKLGNLEHEAFWCLWFDNHNRLIVAEELFRGTLGQTSVYPREVVKNALKFNAAAVIFSHPHPSGHPTPSEADKRLTIALKDALRLVDVRVLDHFVVAGNQAISLAEMGLI